MSENDTIEINVDKDIDEQLEAQKDKLIPTVEAAVNQGNVHILQGLSEMEIVHVINVNEHRKEKLIFDIFDLKIFRKLIVERLERLEIEWEIEASTGFRKEGSDFTAEEKERLKNKLFKKVGDEEINIIRYLFNLKRDLNTKINGKAEKVSFHKDLANLAKLEYRKIQSSLDDFKEVG